MWNAWKSCNEEFQPRSPPLEDGDIWKNYYQHLFENETNKHDFSSTLRTNKNIKLNIHKLSESESVKLNMPFSIKELKKVLKKLRNGKSPGIDRISNEMIKVSFDTLRKAYAKLFNLALTVGEVPNIWCKGLYSKMELLSTQRTIDQYVSLVVSVSFSQMLSITGFLNLQKDVRLLTMFRLAFLRIIEQLITFSLLNQLFLRMFQIQVEEKFIAVPLISKKLLILFGMKAFSRSSWK